MYYIKRHLSKAACTVSSSLFQSIGQWDVHRRNIHIGIHYISQTSEWLLRGRYFFPTTPKIDPPNQMPNEETCQPQRRDGIILRRTSCGYEYSKRASISKSLNGRDPSRIILYFCQRETSYLFTCVPVDNDEYSQCFLCPFCLLLRLPHPPPRLARPRLPVPTSSCNFSRETHFPNIPTHFAKTYFSSFRREDPRSDVPMAEHAAPRASSPSRQESR